MNNSDRVFNLVWGDIDVLIDTQERSQLKDQVRKDIRALIDQKIYFRVAEV